MHDSPQVLDRAGILARIPHQGASCLLDRVCGWDARSIICESCTHQEAAHPYRLGQRLPAVCAVEYAAQAFALHACLKSAQAGATPQVGYLAAIRDLRLATASLDSFSGPLTIRAFELAAESGRMLYSFSVHHSGELIAEGRAAVAIPSTLQ